MQEVRPGLTPSAGPAVRACRYQSATLGTFQTLEFIETFVNYHENIKKCVCLIYDPQRSQRGSLALRAIRLKDGFIEQFKQDKLTGKELREANVSWKDVFVDIPIKVCVCVLGGGGVGNKEQRVLVCLGTCAR